MVLEQNILFISVSIISIYEDTTLITNISNTYSSGDTTLNSVIKLWAIKGTNILKFYSSIEMRIFLSSKFVYSGIQGPPFFIVLFEVKLNAGV